jgi:hypothetical protein
VLLGYVLLVGNPWVNTDLSIAVTDSDSALRLVDVMVFYPSWYLDPETVGPIRFWTSNLRTVLFVGLAIAGLARVSRWLRESAGGAGVFATTVGVIALSAVAAGLTAAVLVTTFLGSPFPVSDTRDVSTEYLLGQLSGSASFGVLFGLVLGAVVVAQRQGRGTVTRPTERAAKRGVNAPKSFW